MSIYIPRIMRLELKGNSKNDRFNLGLIGQKQPIPEGKNAGEIFVDVLLLTPMMNPVV